LPPLPSGEELDAMISGMPAGTVETFVQVVQPILMNHCMTSGCHGLQSDGRLQLMRPSSAQGPSRRVTQRNLYTVLQCMDWDNPAKSILLTAPRAPHGGGRAAVFADRQVTQYRRLTEWVFHVTGKQLPEEAASAEQGMFSAIDAPAAAQGEEETPPRPLPAKLVHARPMPRAAQPAKAATSAAGDPFDPASFNQQLPPEPATPAAKALHGKAGEP
jgi:hypothetical protein